MKKQQFNNIKMMKLLYQYQLERFWMGNYLLTHEGRVIMIDELISIMEFIKPLDNKMDKIWMNAWEPYGITAEWIEKQLNAYAEHRRSFTVLKNLISDKNNKINLEF